MAGGGRCPGAFGEPWGGTRVGRGLGAGCAAPWAGRGCNGAPHNGAFREGCGSGRGAGAHWVQWRPIGAQCPTAVGVSPCAPQVPPRDGGAGLAAVPPRPPLPGLHPPQEPAQSFWAAGAPRAAPRPQCPHGHLQTLRVGTQRGGQNGAGGSAGWEPRAPFAPRDIGNRGEHAVLARHAAGLRAPLALPAAFLGLRGECPAEVRAPPARLQGGGGRRPFALLLHRPRVLRGAAGADGTCAAARRGHAARGGGHQIRPVSPHCCDGVGRGCLRGQLGAAGAAGRGFWGRPGGSGTDGPTAGCPGGAAVATRPDGSWCHPRGSGGPRGLNPILVGGSVFWGRGNPSPWRLGSPCH